MKRHAKSLMLTACRWALRVVVGTALLVGQSAAADRRPTVSLARQPLHANQPTLVLGSDSRADQHSSRRRWSGGSRLRRIPASAPRAGFVGTSHVSPLSGFKREQGERVPTPASGQTSARWSLRESPRNAVHEMPERAPRSLNIPVHRSAPVDPPTRPEPVNRLRVTDRPVPMREAVPDGSARNNSQPETPPNPIRKSQPSAPDSLSTLPPPLAEPAPQLQNSDPPLAFPEEALVQLRSGPADTSDAPVPPARPLPAESVAEPADVPEPLAQPNFDPLPEASQPKSLEVDSAHSAPPLETAPPQETVEPEAAAVPEDHELAKARCLLRLFDSLGLKPGQQISTVHQSLAVEASQWSPPAQQIQNQQLRQRDSAWQPSGSEVALDAPSDIDRLPIDAAKQAPQLLTEQNSETNGPSAESQTAEADKRETPALDTPFPTTIAPESSVVSKYNPAALEPADLTEEQAAGEETLDNYALDTAHPQAVQPAPSTLVPSSLANDNQVGVTYRVFDRKQLRADETPRAEMESPHRPMAGPDGQLAIQEKGTARPAQSADTEPEDSGRVLRNRLKSAIDELVGESAVTAAKQTHSAHPRRGADDRSPPSPQLVKSSGTPHGPTVGVRPELDPKPIGSELPTKERPEPSSLTPNPTAIPDKVVPHQVVRRAPTYHVVGDRNDIPLSRPVETPTAAPSRAQMPTGAGPVAGPLQAQPRLLANQPSRPVPPRGQAARVAEPTTTSIVGGASAVRRAAEVRLAARTSYPLQAPGRVAKVTVADRSVCEVMQHSPYELALIGKQEGQTDVAVWLVGEATAHIYRIVVGRGGTPTGDQGKLEQLLAELFPASQVQLTQRSGTVHVDGNAKDRQEAIQILSVVRSVKLVPVVDNLQLMRR